MFHRARFHNFFLVQRWNPEAALRRRARELLLALHPIPGETQVFVTNDTHASFFARKWR